MNAIDSHAVLEREGFLSDLCPEREEDFVRACKEGLDEVVAAFLDVGMAVNARAPISQETALIKAAEGGHLSTISLLVSRGAGLELRDGSDDTAFRTALNWSHPEAARLLAKLGADVDAASKYGETCLDEAVGEKPEHLDLLLELGANPNYSARGRSPLATAIGKPDIDVVVKLLDHGASPTSVCDALGTGLHKAAREGHQHIVELFLARGADRTVTDRFGLLALDHALLTGAQPIVELLGTPNDDQRRRAAVWQLLREGRFDDAVAAIDAGVHVDARDAKHMTPLLHCAEAGDLSAVKALLARGANPSVSQGWRTPVSVALAGGHVDVVHALIDAGARVFDDDGECSGFNTAVWEGKVDVVKAFCARASADDKRRLGGAVRSAVMQKNVAMVRALVEGGVFLDDRSDNGGETALIGAVGSWHDHDVVVALVEGGAGLEVADTWGVTPLLRLCDHYAWHDGCAVTLRYLLEKGARFDRKGQFGNTPLLACKDAQKAIVVDWLVHAPLARGASAVELARLHSWATLQAFITAGRPELIKEVIDAGVSPNPPAGLAVQTVLYAACSAEQLELVQDLLARGAEVDRGEQYGSTPLSIAAGKADTRILRALLDAGADVNRRSPSGSTAAHAALNRLDNLRVLAERGARFDQPSNSALLGAARHGHDDAVAFLLAHGAKADVRSSYGETPLVAAIEKGHPDVARLLIDAGASPSYRSRASGQTPLHAAALKGDAALVRLLVERGGDLDLENRDGESARAIVAQRKPLRTALKDLLGPGPGRKPPVEPFDPALTTVTPAWAAVYRSDTAAVLAAIDGGSLGKNEQDAWGTTPLMAAVLRRNLPLIEALLQRRVDVALTDKHKAMASDHVGFGRDAAIEALLAPHQPSFTSMDRLNATAARSLLADEVQGLINRGEIQKLVGLVARGGVHVHLGVDGRPLVDLVAHDEAMTAALVDRGVAPSSLAITKKKTAKKQTAKKKAAKAAKKHTAKKKAKTAKKKAKTAKTAKKKTALRGGRRT